MPVNRFGRWFGVLVLLTVLLYFILGLLTNYASEEVPRVFRQNPALLWGTIAGVLVILIISDMLQSFSSNISRGIHKKKGRSPKMSSFKRLQRNWDVFVSYSHVDYEWVHHELVPWLRQHHFEVLVDEDFRGGEFGVEQMEKGVVGSKRVLAVFSPDYFRSEWSTLESVMAQCLDPAGRERKLVPVLFRDCTIPLRLSVLHYRDLSDGDREEWNRLVEDLM